MSEVPTVTILSEGTEISVAHTVLSVETSKVANKIPYAQIVLIDGDAAKQDFPISASSIFEPGKLIEIKMRYESDTTDSTVFKGIVISQNIKSSSTASRLIVELKDICIKLDGERRSAVYANQNIGQVIKTILKRNNLTAGTIDSSPGTHQQLIQYQSSDWDFLLMRADVNELIIMVNDGQLSAIKPNLSQTAKREFKYGIDSSSTTGYGFDMSVDISQQYRNVDAKYWQIENQKVSPPAKASAFSLYQGNGAPDDKTAKKIERTESRLSSMINGVDHEMKAWANSAMQKNRLSMFRGTITLKGDAKIKPGDLIEITGVGELFEGKTLITGISHVVNRADGWRSIIQFGLSARWYAEQHQNIDALPAAGLLPHISGLQIAVVESFKPDPEQKYQLKVRIPALDDKDNIVWARLSTLYAGKDKGLFFVPDPGDEVIVGFINDDPREAIILGGAYSKKNNPPEGFGFDEKNKQQGVITKGNLQLSFEDETETIKITTPKQNGKHNEIRLKTKEGITLSDAFENNFSLSDKGITLKDKHGNSIVMDSNGLSFKSVKDISLDADGAATFSATNDMKLKADTIDLN